MSIALSPLERFARHQVVLERSQLQAGVNIAESGDSSSSSTDRGRGGGRGGRGGGRGGRGGGGGGAPEANAFLEQMLRGTVTKVDYKLRKGEVTSKEVGVVQFFLEQTEYGLRKVKQDDSVAFRLDTFRPRPAAIELRPVAASEGLPSGSKPTVPITLDDVMFFISECGAAQVPIYQIRRVLLARDDWVSFMVAAFRFGKQEDVAISILKVTNCAENIINPIHRPVLKSFLELLCAKVPLPSTATATAVPLATSLFPGVLNDMLTVYSTKVATSGCVPALVFSGNSSDSPSTEKAVMAWVESLEAAINVAIEVLELLTLFDSIFVSSGEVTGSVGQIGDMGLVADSLILFAVGAEAVCKKFNVDVEAAFFAASSGEGGTPKKSKAQLCVNGVIIRRLRLLHTRATKLSQFAKTVVSSSAADVSATGAMTSAVGLLPTSSDFSLPTWDPRSPFNPINLPIADTALFDSSVTRGAEELADMLLALGSLPHAQLADYRYLAELLDGGTATTMDPAALKALQAQVSTLVEALHHNPADEKAYIDAHCQLLRADIFNTFVNVVGHVVFPGIKAFQKIDLNAIKRSLTKAQKEASEQSDFPAVRFEATPLETSLTETKENAKHHRFYTNLEYQGKLLCREFEFSRSNTYLFTFDEADPSLNGREKPIRWDQALQMGTLVLFACSEDPSEVKEIFYGTVSCVDEGASCRKMVAIHPVAGSDFDKGLLPCLERNKRNGTSSSRSLMVESNAFFTGFQSVMSGLKAFQGTASSRLPFGEILLAPRAVTNYSSAHLNIPGVDDDGDGDSGAVVAASDDGANTNSPRDNLVKSCLLYVSDRKARLATQRNDLLFTNGVADGGAKAAKKKKKSPLAVRPVPSTATPPSTWHIPQFAAAAFSQLLFNTRVQCRFDRGQDQAMRKLGGRQVLLVQGPPGTGKSFIGCRVVETYIRYKQMLASGSIINVLDTDHLPDTNLTTIAPSLFASAMGAGDAAAPAAGSSSASSPAASNPSAYIGPIVVITYKNHALDEFLVDLRRSGLWSADRTRFESSVDGAAGTTTMYPGGCKLVRIGSRSGEEELHQFNLNTLVAASGIARSKVAPYRERIGVLGRRAEKLASEVGRYLENGNVPAKLFQSMLTPEQARSMRFEDLPKWLDGADLVKNHEDPEDENSSTIQRDYYLGLVRSKLQQTLVTKAPPLPVHAFDAVLKKPDATSKQNNAEGEDVIDPEAAALVAGLIADGRGHVSNTAGAENDDNVRGTVFGAMQREVAAEARSSGDEDLEGGGKKTTSSSSATDVPVSFRYHSAMSAESLSLIAGIDVENMAATTSAAALPLPEGLPATTPAVTTLFSLPLRQRHLYYAYLLQTCIRKRAVEYVQIQKQIENLVVLRNHAQEEAKLQLLQQADVIGLTTTGCAMNQNLLRALRPRVLVVEEAAEVLESQLLACMTDNLAQVVLIGDHYQLKPRVETFALERHNNMNTSLFERLSSVISPILLVEQRRMRPAISRLVRPFYNIGSGIVDHESVLTRPFIDVSGNRHSKGALGLQHDAYLWTHAYPEETAATGLSKVNMQEITMVYLVVSHLLSQGVSPSSITVITPYLGQRRAIQGTFVQAALRTSNNGTTSSATTSGSDLASPTAGVLNAMSSVRVSTVDMFQGDENDIVILSLVRTERLTDFMRMRNRMIVACSRARFAMVVIGCEGLLRQAEHWAQVVDILSDDSLVGEGLPVTSTVTVPIDPSSPTFSSSPTGMHRVTRNLLLYADGTTVATGVAEAGGGTSADGSGNTAAGAVSSLSASMPFGGGGLLASAMMTMRVDKKRRTEEEEESAKGGGEEATK